MSSVPVLHGGVATLVLCLLTFLPETGIPMPLVPADMVLLAGGVGIAGADLDPWLYLPAVTLAAVAGALCGYAISRRVGAAVLEAVARRLHVTRQLDRAGRALRASGARGLACGRLVPGIRVPSTVLAGSMGMALRPVATAVVPTAVVWVAVMTALGVAAGAPVERLLAGVDEVALIAVAVAVLGAVTGVPVLRALRRHAPASVAATAHTSPRG